MDAAEPDDVEDAAEDGGEGRGALGGILARLSRKKTLQAARGFLLSSNSRCSLPTNTLTILSDLAWSL